MLAGLQARLIAWGGAVLAILAILATIFRAGKRSAEAEQARASLDILRQRSKTDDAVAQLDDGAVRGRLGRWVSDGKQ